ncbi:hypothetical protein TorRG33x02_039650 [Trema orientale]|uniref:Uncharacterized protein n=1 Tax=Trema orientale TaxID=63057 RepID=A0A2P5FQY0_TREOI|nr:hypothetical protein TorRG33x02_039650 [Trema orientale]
MDLGINKVLYHSPPASASLRTPPTNQPTNKESNNLHSFLLANSSFLALTTLG